MQPVVWCGCGRQMTAQTLLGFGCFRCACGTTVKIDGLPREGSSICRVQRGRYECGREKTRSHPTCLDCAVEIAKATVRSPKLSRELAQATGYSEFLEKQSEVTSELIKQRQLQTELRRDERAVVAFNLVYYVALRPGVVKIGSTRNLRGRMNTLRIRDEDVLAAEPGTEKLERVRHKQFADQRVSGRLREDFALDERLQAHIDQTRETHGDPWTLASLAMTRQREALAEKPGQS